MPMVWVDIDVSDVIHDISTEDLEEELDRRGEETQNEEVAHGDTLPMLDYQDPFTGRFHSELMSGVYEARRNGDDARALELVDRLIYAAIGRIV